MFSEFKKFIGQGNVLDLAVGVIIGGAFGKITASLVSDIIMPVVGLLLGKIDFKSLALNIGEKGADGKFPVSITYGNFIQVVVEFLVVAYVIFMVVKAANSAGLTNKKTDEKA